MAHRTPGSHFGEEVFPFVIDEDEGGEVFDLDFADGFHAKPGELDDFDLFDVFGEQPPSANYRNNLNRAPCKPSSVR